jgi:nucleotide-binding universal stress UspA family protein
MADERRVLACVDGTAASQLLQSALPLLGAGARWRVVHVIDTRGRVDLGVLRGGVTGAGPLPAHLVAAIEDAGQERAHRVLAAADAGFTEFGLASDVGVVRVGEPGREICAAAAGWPADLIVLRASRHGRVEPGPRSVGHTARFVVDHAPCPVLLLRG